jgi:hypothetical protein
MAEIAKMSEAIVMNHGLPINFVAGSVAHHIQ